MTGKKIEIPNELVEKTVMEFLNGKLGLFSRRGSRLVYMAATMQGNYSNFVGAEEGKATKINIAALIGRKVARRMGINPKNKNTSQLN